jgi:RNA polymerase sigma factor (sigma-70 family)
MIGQGKRGISPQLEVLWTAGTLGGFSDAQLLRRFVQARDCSREIAFRELLSRHGPMVLAICRQILRQPDDADDAFQATFLVLVRKARSIRMNDSLAPWLSSVAFRTAQRARARASRYRPADEEKIKGLAEPAENPSAFTVDLRPLLYEELERLPDRYRSPIVLCHLEGKTHEQAARLLRWPVGTLSGRLSRGRQLLRSRLERRGVNVSATLYSASWLAAPGFSLATRLVECTARAAAQSLASQSVSTSVLYLTKGVLKTMFLRKLGTVSAVVLLGAVSGGAIVAAHRPAHPVAPARRAVTPVSPSPSAPSTSPDQDSGSVAPSNSSSQADSKPMLAARSPDCPEDCPLACAGDLPPYCPISMAASAFTKVVGHFQQWTASR